MMRFRCFAIDAKLRFASVYNFCKYYQKNFFYLIIEADWKKFIDLVFRKMVFEELYFLKG